MMTEAQWIRVLEIQSQTIDILFTLLTRRETESASFANLVTSALADIRCELTQLFQEMTMTIEQLETEVTENESVSGSAVTLLTRLSQMIKDAGTDPAKLDALTQRLDASNAALAAAVAANTPAETETDPNAPQG